MCLKTLVPVFCGLLLLSVVVAACDTQFEPFAETSNQFTILGFFDTDADTQFVRVVPLRPVVDRVYEREIDAVVHSFDLTDGTSVAWTDSVVAFPDGTFGHVFWSDFRAVPEHTYRVEVERSDGFMASAETTVPEPPGDPTTVYGALNETAFFAPLFWPGVRNVIEADVLYDFEPISCLANLGRSAKNASRHVRRIIYDGDDKGELSAGGEWRIGLNLLADRDSLKAFVGREWTGCTHLYRLEARLASPSTEFDPPGGVWDREVLIQPGVFSNVQGGFGFVGSVARTTVNWRLSPVALSTLGYEQD